MIMDDINIVNNTKRHRFETTMNGEEAYVEYQQDGNTIMLTHTFVPEKLRGQHIADHLAKFALAYVENENLEAKIYCPFISTYVRRHPENEKWQGMLA